MALFSVFGIFAIFGGAFAVWFGFLVVFWITDMVWTNGWATTYVGGTTMVLQQVWGFLQTFFSVLQRFIALAPRALQVFIFIIIGTFVFGILVNWFVAANVVCTTEPSAAWTSDNIMDVWVAKSLSTEVPGLTTEGNTSLQSYMSSQGVDASGAAISGINWLKTREAWAAGCDPGQYIGDIGCDGPEIPGWDHSQSFSCFQAYLAGETVAPAGCQESNLTTENFVTVNEDGTKKTYSVDSSTSGKAGQLSFITNIVSRDNFVLNKQNSSFVAVKNEDDDGNSKFVTYTCDEKTSDVQVGIYGISNVFSMTTMLIIMVFCSMIWLMKFFGVF